MNEGRTSRRAWDFRYPISAEDRLEDDWRNQDRGDPYVHRERRSGSEDEDAFGQRRHAERGYGAGRFGEGRLGREFDEPVGDNPFGTYPSTGEVMRGDRGAPPGGWRGGGEGRRGEERSEGRGEWPGEWRGGAGRQQFGGGRGGQGMSVRGDRPREPWPDQSRTPWQDRYAPDDPETRERLAQAYGVSDVGQLDAQSWRDDENRQRRQASARWRDEGGQFPESERPGAGGRIAGWPGEDWSQRGYGHPHGRDESYESFSGAPQRVRWGQGGGSGAGSRYGGQGYQGSRNEQTARRVAPKGYQRSDERIHEDVCERLTHQPQLDVRDVEVQVREGVVTLTGTVRDRRHKYRIEDIVDDTFGVRDVHNQLRVQREDSGQGRQGSVPQPGIGQGSGQPQGHVSGVSVSGSATGSTASSYTGGMEVGAGEVPKGTDPYGGSTRPLDRST